MATDPNADSAPWTLVFLCWLIAVVGTLGSLFFSQVMGLVPCSLCWFQRIFLFPLAVVFTVALFPLDTRVVRYAAPITAGGWLVAFYQNLLVWGVVEETLSPCQAGVSCSEVDFALFGFVTIPLLSLAAFTVMGGLLVALQYKVSK